ncbi:MAG TPA: hypothetical protein VEA69_16925 [Tepidisphaeraceae bacterium]|nr:hypothetical protein [Tepidisphaeraceae bacterium]
MPTPPARIAAVWAQPLQLFPTWKARGKNVVIGFEKGPGSTQKQWEDAAAAMGLWFITLPEMHRIDEQAAQPYRLGFMQADEPDRNLWKANEPADSPNNRTLIPAGEFKGWRKPEVLEALYAACKRAAPHLPVLVNFAGPTVTAKAYTHGRGHARYIAAADWLCGDWHTLNADAIRYSPQQVIDMLRRLAFWSAAPGLDVKNGYDSARNIATMNGSKLKLGYVEASDQNLINQFGRGPLVDEYEAQVRLVMDAGCVGWVDFATRFGEGWDWTKSKGFDGSDDIPGLPERMLKLSEEFVGKPATPVSDAAKAVAQLLDDVAGLKKDNADLRGKLDTATLTSEMAMSLAQGTADRLAAMVKAAGATVPSEPKK